MAERKPVLSANAPAKVGSKYKQAEKVPEITPASISENPHTFER